MAKFVVMSNGVGRCATKWLAHMFRQNASGISVTHEGFSVRGPRLARQWDELEDKTDLLIDFSWKMLGLVHSYRFKPTFCVLLRDPWDVVQSWMTRTIVGAHISPDEATKRSFAYYYFTKYLWYLDSGIFLAKDSGLNVTYWDYHRYTTLDGFIELAEYVGAKLKPDVKLFPPIDVKPDHEKINIIEWCGGDTKLLDRALEGFQFAKAAYDQIWSERWASTSQT